MLGYEAAPGTVSGHPTTLLLKSLNRLNRGNQCWYEQNPALRHDWLSWVAWSIEGSPAHFGKLIVDETEKWGKVVEFANIKPN